MGRDPKEESQPTTSPPAEQERLAQRLREAREYLGLSQEFVAEQLGIPRAAVSAMETAKRKVSSLELRQLSRLYRRDYAYFLGGEDEESDQEEAVVAALYRATKKLSAVDKEQVLKFAQFLQQAGGSPRTPHSDAE
jgi:transcriptional regulator with XRE-family HTH domain